MAARIAWLLNLDAERELAARHRYAPEPTLEARIARLSSTLTMLLAPEDRIVGRDAALDGCTHALAFCPTPSALLRMRQRLAAEGATLPLPDAPPLALLATVNRRAFCAALGQTLPGAAYVRDMDALVATLERGSPSDTWVLKRDFSFAGRERRRVHGSALDLPTLGFARRSFARGEGLQVEPWLARTHDFAQHGFVLRGGTILLGPALSQQCDARGTWQRSEPLAPGALFHAEQRALEASTRQAGEALAHAGYVGPYGVDAFRFDQEGRSPGFQPRSEINARFSMGYPRALLERALASEDYPQR